MTNESIPNSTDEILCGSKPSDGRLGSTKNLSLGIGDRSFTCPTLQISQNWASIILIWPGFCAIMAWLQRLDTKKSTHEITPVLISVILSFINVSGCIMLVTASSVVMFVFQSIQSNRQYTKWKFINLYMFLCYIFFASLMFSLWHVVSRKHGTLQKKFKIKIIFVDAYCTMSLSLTHCDVHLDQHWIK